MSTPTSSSNCRRILYSGNVQGVGFRDRTRRIAESHVVTGFVKNLPDGGVELVVTGRASTVKEFLAEVADRLSDNIRSQSSEPFITEERFSSFEIRH